MRPVPHALAFAFTFAFAFAFAFAGIYLLYVFEEMDFLCVHVDVAMYSVLSFDVNPLALN